MTQESGARVLSDREKRAFDVWKEQAAAMTRLGLSWRDAVSATTAHLFPRKISKFEQGGAHPELCANIKAALSETSKDATFNQFVDGLHERFGLPLRGTRKKQSLRARQLNNGG